MQARLEAVEHYLLDLQQRICDALADEDGKEQFITHLWQDPQLGQGRTCVMQGGLVIEKGGVNFSRIAGKALPAAAIDKHPKLDDTPYRATGLSTVIHPTNPFVPTSHLNLRYFCITAEAEQEPVWWFGGGFDLTPYYGFSVDCRDWHESAKKACDHFGPDVYAKFKKACDEYFFIKHRQEPRGIGGIFFDNLSEWGFDKTFEFVRAIGEAYLEAYLLILARRKNTPFTDQERQFQLYRRGRYVEFNLIYDRGTLFGLQSGGAH